MQGTKCRYFVKCFHLFCLSFSSHIFSPLQHPHPPHPSNIQPPSQTQRNCLYRFLLLNYNITCYIRTNTLHAPNYFFKLVQILRNASVCNAYDHIQFAVTNDDWHLLHIIWMTLVCFNNGESPFFSLSMDVDINRKNRQQNIWYSHLYTNDGGILSLFGFSTKVVILWLVLPQNTRLRTLSVHGRSLTF